MPDVKVTRAGYLAYYYNRRRRRARVEGVGVLGPLSPLILTMRGDTADVSILAIGDSTSASDVRYFKPLATSIAALYPAYTVEYVPPDGSGGYGAPVTIQSGSGTHTLRIYNNSVSATAIEYLMGDKYDGAFITPGHEWDAIFWNHGKNLASGGTLAIVEGELAGAILQTMVDFPNAKHVVIDQYPNRDNTNMDIVSTSWRDLVAFAPQIGLVNIKTGTSYVSGDYTDNLHMTDAAYTAKLNPLLLSYWTAQRPGEWAAETAWNTVTATNLLRGDSNEDYANFGLNGTSGSVPGAAAAVPFGWTTTGTVAYSQEGVITYAGASLSQEMQGSGATFARMGRGLTSTKVNLAKGQRCWLTVAQYVPSGAANTVGRIQVTTNGTGSITETSRSSSSRGAWRIKSHGPFTMPSDMTQCTAYLYHDSAAAPDATHPVYYAWAAFTASPMPRFPS